LRSAELRALATAGATVVVLHHKPKGEGSQYRGSSDIRAGVDVAFAVSQDREAGTVKFACFKNRLAPEFALTLRPELTLQGDFTVVDGGRDENNREQVQALRAAISSEPGLSQDEILQRVDLPHKKAISLLRQFEGKLWRKEKGMKNRFRFFLIREAGEDDAKSLEWQNSNAI
jgi:hypothetical protein